MARSFRRRRKQRVYWIEIGFLILGLIALRPSLVTDIVAMGRPAPTRYPGDPYFNSAYSGPAYSAPAYSNVAYSSPAYSNGAYSNGAYGYATANWNAPPTLTSQTVYWPRQDQSLATASVPAAASNVAWPDAQMHQWVHYGNSAPLVASPGWSNPPSNGTLYPPPSQSAPGYTGRY